MIKRYALYGPRSSEPYRLEQEEGSWVRFEDHENAVRELNSISDAWRDLCARLSGTLESVLPDSHETPLTLIEAQESLKQTPPATNLSQLAADKRELVEMLEKYQSHNRINNDTESGLFEEAAALIAKHKEG